MQDQFQSKTTENNNITKMNTNHISENYTHKQEGKQLNQPTLFRRTQMYLFKYFTA